MPRRAQTIWWVLWVLSCLLTPLAACAPDQPSLAVVVIVLDDPTALSQASYLRVRSGRPNGTPIINDLDAHQTRFGLRLPEGFAGLLQLELGAYRDDGCLVGEASARVTVDDQPVIEVHLALPLLDPPKCELTLSVSGYGSVTSSPEGFTCSGRCTASFPLGVPVTLTATPDVGALFDTYGGACSGVTCTLTLSGPARVSATFVGTPCTNCVATGPALHGLYVAAPDALFAVGERGTVLSIPGDPGRRKAIAAPVATALYGISGTGRSDQWIVGAAGTVLRFDGAGRFTVVASGTQADLLGVYARGAADVFIVGRGGVALRWDGAALAPIESGTQEDLVAVHGGGGEVFVAGARSLRRWDGARLSASANAAGPFFNLYVQGPTEVWLVGRYGMRYDGARVLSQGGGDQYNNWNEWPYYTVYSPSPGRAIFLGGTLFDTKALLQPNFLPATALASGGAGPGSTLFWVGSEGQIGMLNP